MNKGKVQSEKQVKRVRPNYPYVLVRVLPKSQQVGLIVLPDKQNKPAHEGIVLDVYDPYTKVVDGKSVVHAPTVNVGDHILFQHFEGVPVDAVMFNKAWYNGEYRLVTDDPVGDGRNGILAVLEEQSEDEVIEILDNAISEAYMNSNSNSAISGRKEIISQILEKAIVIPKDKKSVTVSGG